MQLSFSLRQWTACSPYHLSREDWQYWAVNGLDPQRESKPPPLGFIPPIQRRRLNQAARLMFSALHQLNLPDNTPLVFASHDGETNRSFSLWLELLYDGSMSPMSFGLCVHNALAGSWSLHSHNCAEMNALTATDAVLETALLEACILLFEGAPLVAVAVVEDPVDNGYDVSAVRAAFPYALTMLVEKGDTFRMDFHGRGRGYCTAPDKYWGALEWIRGQCLNQARQTIAYTSGDWIWQRRGLSHD